MGQKQSVKVPKDVKFMVKIFPGSIEFVKEWVDEYGFDGKHRLASVNGLQEQAGTEVERKKKEKELKKGPATKCAVKDKIPGTECTVKDKRSRYRIKNKFLCHFCHVIGWTETAP